MESQSDIALLKQLVEKTFREAFGRTPLKERLDDVLTQALDLSRSPDLSKLKEESGDLLCSLLQLFNECGWDPRAQVESTLAKIRVRTHQYRTLSRRISVALLGGAFNPVTSGHLGVAQFVLNTSKAFDEVWLMPCFQHMHGKKMQSAEDRLEMCRLAARRDGRVKVFDYEIRNRFRGETYHLVKQLLDEPMARDECYFSLIIGQDNANSLANWVNGEDLERMIRFVVVPRQGVAFDASSIWYLRPPHIYLAGGSPVMQTSSTLVRKMLEDNDPTVSNHVDPAVLQFIRDHGLYQSSMHDSA